MSAERGIPRRVAAGRHGIHAVFTEAGLTVALGLGSLYTRSPYQPGDWVQMHGHPGYPEGPRRWGFRGYVLGGRGSTWIYGLTDDGGEWCEHSGHLVPDGTREGVSISCTCCPPPRRPAKRRPPEQLDIFGVLIGASRG